MKVKAYAKINIGLNVVERYENGYHHLNMIMVPIDLFDTLDITFDTETTLTANKSYIPTDEKNSIIKVVNKLREKYHFEDHFKIHLVKNIPSQAGLGGGSSDAAMTIKVLNSLLDLKMTQQEMIDFGKTIGADVPFCLTAQPAFVDGIGEIIEPFDLNCPFHILLVKPKVGVSTKTAFEMLDFSQLRHPDIRLIQQALMNNDYDTLVKTLDNDLEQSACQIAPIITKLKKELTDFGFDCAVMSGSGSTVFALTKDATLLDRAFNTFQRKYYFVKKTKIIHN